jgi:hypothetical protein
MEVIRTLLTEGKTMKATGLDADQARDVILPSLSGAMQQITGGNPRSPTPSRCDWSIGVCTACTTT